MCCLLPPDIGYALPGVTACVAYRASYSSAYIFPSLLQAAMPTASWVKIRSADPLCLTYAALHAQMTPPGLWANGQIMWKLPMVTATIPNGSGRGRLHAGFGLDGGAGKLPRVLVKFVANGATLSGVNIERHVVLVCKGAGL